jgi:ubiquinone/menaquinone biosynthesis C-methylase UbiE
MQKYNAQEVRQCYDLAAQEYAKSFLNELDGKPFDRNILDRFSQMLPEGGLIYDFGCGSGQTTKYLNDKHKQKVVGLDFSEKSMELARTNFSEIEFRVDDMLASKMNPQSADGILAFYAIVHFTYKQVEQALAEWYRLLKPGGYSLFSFHVGKEIVPIEKFLNVDGANATWRFLETDRVLKIAEKVGFQVYEAIIRYPYIGAEHPSKRAYIWLKR